jgi:hypothetical protein
MPQTGRSVEKRSRFAMATYEIRWVRVVAGDLAFYLRGVSAIVVTVKDETIAGKQLAVLAMQIEADRMTVRELIRARVHQEVRERNSDVDGGRYFGLVEPSGAERELNGRRARRRVDPEVQTEIAVSGFERGQILLLVDDRQVQDLDQLVTLRQGSVVRFLKLVPLVGG